MARLTQHQKAILGIVIKGCEDGSWVDIDQMLDSLPTRTSKQGLQCSIRHLERRGLIERKATEYRRRKQRRIVAPTVLAYKALFGEGHEPCAS